MIGLRFFDRMIGLISTIILARLLLPEDFGLVAMATALMAFVVMFSQLGVQTVLVQKTHIDNIDLDSAWSLQALIGILQAAVLAVLAVPLARFYDEPRLAELCYVLALAVFIQGFKNIGIVAFQREMTFDKEFILGSGQRLIAFAVTVTLAVIFQSYWALAIGILVSKTAQVVLSFAMHPYRPGWSRARWGALFHFSKWLLMNSGLLFLAHKGPIFILGRLSNAQGVGLFTLAYEIAMMPTVEMVAPINRAVFPGYARMKNDDGQFRQGFLDVAGMIAFITLPVALGIAAVAKVIIPIVLGQNWIETIPLVEALAISGALTCLLSNTGVAFIAIGRPVISTILNAAWVGLLLPAMVVGGILSGPYGISIAILAVTFIILPFNIGTLLYLEKIRIRDYIKHIARPVISSSGMFFVLQIWLVPYFQHQFGEADILLALVSILSGVVLYLTFILVLWTAFGRQSGAEQHALEFLAARVRAIRGPARSL